MTTPARQGYPWLGFWYRVAYFLMLVILAGGLLPSWAGSGRASDLIDGLIAPAQRTLAGGLVIAFLIIYRTFLADFLRYIVEHPVQAAILILVVMIVYGLAGTSYGLPGLFWNEYPLARAASAAALTLLLSVLGVNAYFFDRKVRENVGRVREFLRSREVQYPRWKALEPTPGSSREEIQQFLRVARLPFLTMVSLPALFPRVFPYVPRFAPVARDDGPPAGAGAWLALPDVSRDGLAWALGLACWGAGIFAGIVIVKVLIKVADLIATREERLEFRRREGDVAERPLGNGSARPDPVAEPSAAGRPAVRRLVKVLGWLVIASAIGLTAGDVATSFATRSGTAFWPDLLFFVDLAAIGVAGLASIRLAFALHPKHARRNLRFLTVFFIALAMILVWDRAFARYLLPRWTFASGANLCILLATVSMLAAWFHMFRTTTSPEGRWILKEERRVRWGLPVVLGVTAWAGLVNNPPYKLRFPHLDYREPVNLEERVAAIYPEIADPSRAPGGSVGDRAALRAWVGWARAAQQHQATRKPKLVIVCASGGASRAAYWTALILDRLGRVLDGHGFHEGVRMVTGASGGMVGAAYYARWRYDLVNDPPGSAGSDPSDLFVPAPWVSEIRTNSLNVIAQHIAQEGIARVFLPRFPGASNNRDRGSVLEADWPRLEIEFRRFRELEEQGRIPSLIFSPVIVDNGRRLLISNLDLHDLAVNRGDELDDGGNRERPYSLTGLEFYKVFQPAGGDRLALATAARMSASFPFVSPAVNLPCDPPLRVVDAGYYDNYGVNLAVAWIARHWREIKDEISGILLVQVRAFLGRAPRLAPPDVDDGPVGRLLRGVQFFTGPVNAFISGRYTGSVFRNDQELAALMDVINSEAPRSDFFATVVFENSSQVLIDRAGNEPDWPGGRRDRRTAGADPSTEVAMTWYVTQSEKLAMNHAIPTDTTAEHTVLERDPAGQEECPEDPAVSWVEPYKLRFSRGPADGPLLSDPKGENRLRWLEVLSGRVRRARAARDVKRLRGEDESDDEAARRAYDEKEFERALNYEHMLAVKSWWDK